MAARRSTRCPRDPGGGTPGAVSLATSSASSACSPARGERRAARKARGGGRRSATLPAHGGSGCGEGGRRRPRAQRPLLPPAQSRGSPTPSPSLAAPTRAAPRAGLLRLQAHPAMSCPEAQRPLSRLQGWGLVLPPIRPPPAPCFGQHSYNGNSKICEAPWGFRRVWGTSWFHLYCPRRFWDEGDERGRTPPDSVTGLGIWVWGRDTAQSTGSCSKGSWVEPDFCCLPSGSKSGAAPSRKASQKLRATTAQAGQCF